MGICPEYMSEKAVSIGTYCAASGAYVLFGVPNPGGRQPRGGGVDDARAGCASFGGGIEFEPDIGRAASRRLWRTSMPSARRWGLDEYDPARFGASGDRQMEEVLAEADFGEEIAQRLFHQATAPSDRRCRRCRDTSPGPRFAAPTS